MCPQPAHVPARVPRRTIDEPCRGDVVWINRQRTELSSCACYSVMLKPVLFDRKVRYSREEPEHSPYFSSQ